MTQVPRITLEVDGINELKQLLLLAEKQSDELLSTVEHINDARISIQVKLDLLNSSTETRP